MKEAKAYGLDPNKTYEAVIQINEDEYHAMNFENKLGEKLGVDKKRVIYDMAIKRNGQTGRLLIREVE